MADTYDSAPETRRHILAVQELMHQVNFELIRRAAEHDASKLREPEKSVFDEFTPKLKASTYGSDEYKDMLSKMQFALDHHYEHNFHHPEHWERGIRDMTLIDLIEMLCDWMAATKRHADGDIIKSLEINQKRFGYSDELKLILKNTVEELNNG
jgi:hypothetical protein